jgi:hypothetical protein
MKMIEKIKQMAFLHHDVAINLASVISASLVFLSGIGRYRIILVYLSYALLNSSLSFIRPGHKVRYVLLPATLFALYLDITKGPIIPLFIQNSLLITLPVLFISEIVIKHFVQCSIEKLSSGRIFIVCPYCSFKHRSFTVKCASCSYNNSDQLVLVKPSPIQQQKKDIVPVKIFRMLNLSNNEDIVFHMKLFPHKSLIKNGVRQIRTDFIITTDNIIFLDRFFFANSWREKDLISFKTIDSVEGKMKSIFVVQNPFLVINTSSHDVYEIVFKRFGHFKQRISEISEIIGSQNPQIKVKIDFPL